MKSINHQDFWTRKSRGRGLNYHWVKQMYTAALRLGHLCDEDKKNIHFIFKGEFIKSDSYKHSKHNNVYLGELSIEGTTYRNITTVIHKEQDITTFWPNGQIADKDSRKSITTPLVTLYMEDIEKGNTPDPEYTFEKVATHYHGIFKKDPGINPQRILNMLYKGSTKFDQKELEKIASELEKNQEKIKELEEVLEEQKKLTAQERKEAEKWKREYEELQSKDAKAQPPEPEDEWNPGKYKLADVYWGHQGVKSQDAVMLLLCGEDGIGFIVANNWERGLQERFELAKLLVPHNIRYSTWRKDLYSKKWFKNIAIPHDEKGKESEFELKDIYKDYEIPNNGLHTEYYDNGHKMIEVNYKDGKVDGKWSWWYINGQLHAEKNYKDGKLDGMMTTWLDNGEIESERNYKDDKLDGDVIWWNSPTY